MVSAVIGGASKVIASVATYPYQVIKSRLQQREIDPANSNGSGVERRYKGTIDCIVKIWKQDRAVGFFRGIIPNILKVVPSSALTFLVYEETLKILSDSSK